MSEYRMILIAAAAAWMIGVTTPLDAQVDVAPLNVRTAVIDESGTDQDRWTRRLIRKFDFEERALGNFEDMPMHWFRVEGRGFPNYTSIGFDDQIAFSPGHSLQLQLNGGSAAVVLETGVLPAVPEAGYLVTARLRTRDLVNSRARMSAMFVDQHRRPITTAQASSPPMISNDRWSIIFVELPVAPADAAWLIIKLELLQPQEYRPALLGPHELYIQDIDGAAWFDDVMIHQMPRVELTSQDASGVIRSPDRPRLFARVDDLLGQELTAKLTIYDHQGRAVDTQQRPLGPGRPGQWRWTPKLDQLGWYWADLQVLAPDGLIGRAFTAMAYLGPMHGRGVSEADRFVIEAEDLDASQEALLPPLMQRIGSHAVLLGQRHATLTSRQWIEQIEQPDQLVSTLVDQGQSLMLSIVEVPQELSLSAGVDVDRPLGLLAADESRWSSYIQAILTRYSHQVSDWQIGATGSSEAFSRSDLAELYPRINDYFRQYLPDPHVIVPWSAMHELDESAAAPGAAFGMYIPVSVRPDRLAAYARTWPRTAQQHMIWHLQTLDAGRYLHDDRAADLALRLVHAWEFDPRRVSIHRPWTAANHGHTALIPDPLLAVWVNVADQLVGRRMLGSLNLGSGVQCRLLGSGGEGVLVVWKQDADDVTAELDLRLGENPAAVDIWGNRHTLARIGDKQRLRLTAAPMFIEGVDIRLARFRSEFRIDPALAESTNAVHHHTLHVFNPWPRTLTGRMRITQPEHWTIRPRLVPISIPAGQSVEIPVEVSFPLYELAGVKRLTARFDIETDTEQQIDLSTNIEVGLPHIEMKTVLTLESAENGGERDVVISMTVTNIGDQDDSFYAYAYAPELPRQERIISPIRAGETVPKRFRFPNAAGLLSGKSIRTGIRQTDGPAMLNHAVDVP